MSSGMQQRLIEFHWSALSESGVPASKVIEFLQPLADREGLSVYELPVTRTNGTATVFGLVGKSASCKR
jgi:type II secretory pathway component PulM